MSDNARPSYHRIWPQIIHRGVEYEVIAWRVCQLCDSAQAPLGICQPERLGSTSGHPDEPEPSYPAAFSRINKRLPYLLQSSSYAAKPDARVFFVCNRRSEEQKTNTTVARWACSCSPVRNDKRVSILHAASSECRMLVIRRRDVQEAGAGSFAGKGGKSRRLLTFLLAKTMASHCDTARQGSLEVIHQWLSRLQWYSVHPQSPHTISFSCEIAAAGGRGELWPLTAQPTKMGRDEWKNRKVAECS